MALTLAVFGLAVVTFGLVQGQNGTLTSQQVVTAASANFDKLKAETSTKLNALSAVIKAAQGVISDTGANVGNKLTNEYYLEGTQGLLGAADFIRLTNVLTAVTTDNTINNLPGQANDVYKACIAKNTDISALDKALTDVTQKLAKINSVDITYKLAIGSCNFVKPELAPSCVATASTNNPLPQVNESLISGLNIIKGDSQCIQEAADKVKGIGELTVDSLKKVYPTSSLFMVPAKFDALTGRVLGQPSVIANPTAKLAQAKTSLQEAKKALVEAWNAKNINLASAKAYLDNQFTLFNSIVDNVTVQPEAAICKTDAKNAITANQNIQGLALLNCVNNIQAVPTQQALSDFELSLIDRETRENVGSSTVQCFRNLRNVFYPTELQCCVAEMLDDYNVFLDGFILKADYFAKKAVDIKAVFEQCKATALIDSRVQFDADISTLEKCLKLNTKITASSPVSNPYLTVALNSGESTSNKINLNISIPNVPTRVLTFSYGKISIE